MRKIKEKKRMYYPFERHAIRTTIRRKQVHLIIPLACFRIHKCHVITTCLL